MVIGRTHILVFKSATVLADARVQNEKLFVCVRFILLRFDCCLVKKIRGTLVVGNKNI
jgi:hypothetical protein